MYKSIANPASNKVLIALKTFVCFQLILGIRTGSIDKEVALGIFSWKKYPVHYSILKIF